MTVVRAPGRVNLIGEHTDYNGLPVLPMALNREIVLRYSARPDDQVILHNTHPRFPPVRFRLSESIEPDPPGSWGNYPRAAGQALWRETGPLTGFEGEISSTLPMAAGLSSSSALLVATALALLEVSRREVPRDRLATVLALGERYVGVQSGGMDQAICLNGRAGHALRIDFRPVLRLTLVPVPDTWRVIVASSMVEAAKSARARDAYNTRVGECRAALEQVTGQALGTAATDYAAFLSRIPAPDALAAATPLLNQNLLRRFRHVVTEAERVSQAETALRQGDLARFGALLQASHSSLRDDYDVSTPELDQLVAIAEKAGAAGARLTGAGLGGGLLAVTAVDGAEAVMEAQRREYYAARGVKQTEEVLFTAVPSEGATVSPSSTVSY